MYRKFSKRIVGDENQQNEIASHNKVTFSDSGSLKLLTAWLCALVTASLVFVAIIHLALLETLVMVTFVGVVVLGWIVALSFTIRHVSATTAHISIDRSERLHAEIQTDVLHAGENYAIYKDETGSIQFRTGIVLTENRQFLPVTTSAPSHQDTILELYDKGLSLRNIEKTLKDKDVTYYQIQKCIQTYRPGGKGVIDSDSQ